MIRMTVYGGVAPDDEPHEQGPITYQKLLTPRELSEELRTLGLEWKNADYFGRRQTVITLDPVSDEDFSSVRELVREAVSKLEETGLL